MFGRRWVARFIRLIAAACVGVGCQQRTTSQVDRCFDGAMLGAVERSFRSPIDSALAKQVWRLLVDFEGQDRDWEHRSEVRRQSAVELNGLTEAWRHVLLRIATRRVEIEGLHPMLGPATSAGTVLLSDAEGILAADSGLMLLAHEISVREEITDSTAGALYALTEPAATTSDGSATRELSGVRSLLCVLAQQVTEARWSDTVSALVGHLVPSLLLLLETNDPTWEARNSDSVIVEWPDPASGAAARMAELRQLSTIWRSDQTP